jgi:hypothetical protein
MLLFRNTKQDYTCITADIRKIPKKNENRDDGNLFQRLTQRL